MSQIASRNFEEWFDFVGCWRACRCFITRRRLRFFSLDVTHAAPLRPSFCPACTMSSWLDCCVSAKRAMWSSWIFYGNVRWKVKTHIRHCSCHKISFRGVFVLFKKKEKKKSSCCSRHLFSSPAIHPNHLFTVHYLNLHLLLFHEKEQQEHKGKKREIQETSEWSKKPFFSLRRGWYARKHISPDNSDAEVKSVLLKACSQVKLMPKGGSWLKQTPDHR